MGQILVRDIDDGVLERLKRQAIEKHTTLEQVVKDALAREARRLHENVWTEIDEIRERIGPMEGESTSLIREDRDNDEPYR